MPDFSKGKIYEVVNDVNNQVYVGSTCSKLSARMAQHRRKPTNSNLKRLFSEHGVDHFRIILIEDFPCDSKNELLAREEHWRIERGDRALNIKAAVGSPERVVEYQAKYRQDNKEEQHEKQKLYWAEHPEEQKIIKRRYQEKLKAEKGGIITCGCGRSHKEYTKRHHVKSKIHLAWVAAQKSE